MASEISPAIDQIGCCTSSNGTVTVTAPGAAAKPLLAGAGLHVGDRIESGENGSLQLHFNDGMTISAGPLGELHIDAFGISADSDDSIHFSLFSGTFVIASGRAATGPDGFMLQAGDTALGIHHARVAIRIDPLGYDLVSLLPRLKGPTGEVLAFNKVGMVVLSEACQTLRLTGKDGDIPAPLTLPSSVIRETYVIPGLEMDLFPPVADLDGDELAETFQPFQTLPDRFLERQFMPRQVFPNDGPVKTGEDNDFLEDAFVGTRFRLDETDTDMSY
ncbi:MAG: hypothetical protein WD075_13610 [Rhodospirillales bacterium]